ncbi:MAG TPA: peptidase E [Propionibacteriaceae bacterium]|jgi:peptidase E
MTADGPTILATSGGIVPGRRTRFEFAPLTDYAIELAGVSGRAPKVCLLGTAQGDSPAVTAAFYEAALLRGVQASHLTVFPMPNLPDPAQHLLDVDVVWVGGGSVAGLLALWRLHGYDEALRAAWQAGVVLTGVSAGSICWHVGGTTDSYGPDLRPVTDGLAFLPFSNGVHYDSEEQRRPLFQSLIATGVLPAGYATDDGAGLLYRGTELVEAVTEEDGKAAYRVTPGEDGTAVEERLDTRRL